MIFMIDSLNGSLKDETINKLLQELGVEMVSVRLRDREREGVRDGIRKPDHQQTRVTTIKAHHYRGARGDVMLFYCPLFILTFILI